MSELIVALMLWAAPVTGLPPAATLPEIAIETPATLYARIHGEAPGARAGESEVLAVYDLRERTIRLREGWNRDDIVHVSILLHEIVHHMQEAAGKAYACRGELEAVAYDAQDRFLEEHGIDMGPALGLEPLFRSIVTSCPWGF
ncbi:MAG: DUF6647 family protein [Alphaproteobacteria bacterium]